MTLHLKYLFSNRSLVIIPTSFCPDEAWFRIVDVRATTTLLVHLNQYSANNYASYILRMSMSIQDLSLLGFDTSRFSVAN
jgi:hypothetical protein